MANKSIALRGMGFKYEALAQAAGIIAGHLVQENSDETVSVHSTAGGAGQALIAGKNGIIAGGIYTEYSAGETVSYSAFTKGDAVQVVVAAGADAIAFGAALESAGDGTLRALTTGVAIAYALEALDNSAGSSVARLTARLA